MDNLIKIDFVNKELVSDTSMQDFEEFHTEMETCMRSSNPIQKGIFLYADYSCGIIYFVDESDILLCENEDDIIYDIEVYDSYGFIMSATWSGQMFLNKGDEFLYSDMNDDDFNRYGVDAKFLRAV